MLSPVPDAPNMAEDEPEQPSEAMEVDTEDPPLPELGEIDAISCLASARDMYDLVIPSERALPEEFWAAYSDEELLYGLKACLHMYLAARRGSMCSC